MAAAFAKCALVLSLIASAAGAPFSIADFGAVAGVDTHAAALQNGAAFARALADHGPIAGLVCNAGTQDAGAPTMP